LALSRRLSVWSIRWTCMPACAVTCAIPEPIKPAPTTVTTETGDCSLEENIRRHNLDNNISVVWCEAHARSVIYMPRPPKDAQGIEERCNLVFFSERHVQHFQACEQTATPTLLPIVTSFVNAIY
jgi:hypothetical protein